MADEQHRRQVAGHKTATWRELTDAAALHAECGVCIQLLAYPGLGCTRGRSAGDRRQSPHPDRVTVTPGMVRLSVAAEMDR